jgi:hypothetical protein
MIKSKSVMAASNSWESHQKHWHNYSIVIGKLLKRRLHSERPWYGITNSSYAKRSSLLVAQCLMHEEAHSRLILVTTFSCLLVSPVDSRLYLLDHRVVDPNFRQLLEHHELSAGRRTSQQGLGRVVRKILRLGNRVLPIRKLSLQGNGSTACRLPAAYQPDWPLV